MFQVIMPIHNDDHLFSLLYSFKYFNPIIITFQLTKLFFQEITQFPETNDNHLETIIVSSNYS